LEAVLAALAALRMVRAAAREREREAEREREERWAIVMFWFM